MKKIFFSILLGCSLIVTSQAATIVLSGTLGNTSLTADNCYKLRGCVILPSGFTLNIAAGVQIRAEADAALVIERGATINALGSSSSPIIFTSDQAVNSRNPGDWVGVAIMGKAKNNTIHMGGGDITIQRCGNPYSGGGTNDADNSGVIRFVRIEYAGGSPSGTSGPAAFFINSVGTGTDIHDIQVTESADNAYVIAGGKVDLDHLASYNAYAADYFIWGGNTSKMQFLLGMRLDANAHTSTGSLSNGMIIENNGFANSNAPLTRPLISNLSLLGPNYCDEGASVNADFQNGLEFRNNGHADIKNSAIAGWPVNGLYIRDAASIGNTATNGLNTSYTAIIAATAGAQFGNGATWSGTGCGTSMAAWISGASPTSCSESSNDLSLSGFGYSSTLCGNFCSTIPDLSYSGSDLENTDFSAPFDDAFFTAVDYKGALQTDDWTTPWAEWCPQSASYCSFNLLKAKAATGNAEGILFSPNPTHGMVTISFDAVVTGNAQLSVLDKISGRALISKDIKVQQTGNQSVSINVSGFKEGIYPVTIKMDNSILKGMLVVK